MPPSSLPDSSVLLSHSTDDQKYPSYSLTSRNTLLSSLQALHTTVAGTPVSSAIAIGLYIALPGTLTGVLVTKMLKHYIQQRTSEHTSIDDGANSDHYSSDPCTPVLSTPSSPLFEDTDSSTEDHKCGRRDSHNELTSLVPAAGLDFHVNSDALQLEVEHLQEALHQQQLQHQFEESVLEEELRMCQSRIKQQHSREEEDEAQLHALRHDYDTINNHHIAASEEITFLSEIQEVLKSDIDAVAQRFMVMDDELLVQQQIIEELEEALHIAQDDLECARADLAATITHAAPQSEFELAYLESRAELLACQEKNEHEQIAMEVELLSCQRKNEHMQQAMNKVFAELNSRHGDRKQIADLQNKNQELQESHDFVNEQFRIRVLNELNTAASVTRLQEENELLTETVQRFEQLVTVREKEFAQTDKRQADYIAVMEEERVEISKEVCDLKKVDGARLGELQTLRALKQSLQQQVDEAMKHEPQAREAEAERAATIKDNQREVDDAMHKWQESSKECSAIRKELGKACGKVAKSQQKLEELTTNLSQAYTERQSLATQVKELTTSLIQADIDRQSLAAQAEELTTSRSHAVLECQSLAMHLKELTSTLSQGNVERQNLTGQLKEAEEDLHNARSARSDILREKELAEQDFSVREAAHLAEISRRDEALFYANEGFAIKDAARQKELRQRDHALLEAQQKATEVCRAHECLATSVLPTNIHTGR